MINLQTNPQYHCENERVEPSISPKNLSYDFSTRRSGL